MPTAPVDDHGTVLYYEDTGPVAGSDSYVTAVLIHGLIYHGGVFHPLLPLAEKYGIRLVIVNWRDYPGSSPYTPPEIAAFQGDYQTQASIMEDQGRQIAKFLEWFVTKHKVPQLRVIDGKKSGGLSVLAWSLGNVFLLAFLAYAHKLEEKTKSVLEKYLRSAIVFGQQCLSFQEDSLTDPYVDPPVKALGKPIPKECYVPFEDPTIKPEALAEAFLVWVSTYYTPISDITNLTTSDLSMQARPADLKRLPTILQMSQEQREAVTDVPVLFRSAGIYLASIHPDLFWQHFMGSVLDTKGVWPDMNVVLLWCDSAISETAWGAKVMADALKEHETKSETVKRRTDMYKIENANHLVHWDDPERMMHILTVHA
ncbi:hypothetical protein NM688_g1611 [Phlebia brevispora]|uniref:Uncharacterized protein n=1 Tax=Phlebia brevispora TaxID=194682 RepID=A0ACC1TB93_9APHY|nr:hypothetical protein NM688_g1611 [Phlebia brevispora]